MQIMSMGGGYNNPKFYFLIGIVFNLCLLGFFKYSDFFLENFNAFSQLLKLDFDIPLPHILLPLALSFVTFQQIAFLYDCYKSGRSGEKMSLDFIDYALFISFFPQLIAGPIVHHREMIPQFKKLSEGNSSLGETFRPFENFEHSQTPSLASRPKFSKEAKASTSNTRILGEMQGDSMESNQNNPCEAQPNLAPLRGAEKERKGGRSASALLELEADKARLSPKSETAAAVWRVGERGGGAALFAKKSDCINENVSIESRRSERVENAESLNKSNDSIESAKDSNVMDCHEFNKLNSRNDDSMLNSHDSATPSLAMTQNSHSAESAKSTFNYEFLAKGIFIFTIGLFKKLFIADRFAKWADLGFSDKSLNLIEGWASSLSYTFQLYFDFSGYCDMAMGLGLMFGIVLPLNFNSPYKALNIADFWRRWHISLGRFLKECVYIPLGGNRGRSNSSLTQSLRELENASIDRQQALSQSAFSTQPANLTQDTRIADASLPAKELQGVSSNSTDSTSASQSPASNAKILTLRNLFIVAVLSGIWHGAGWGFVLWGLLHGGAMVIHRIYSWWLASVNSSLGNHCIDLAFSHKARTPSPLTLCQNTKNSTSKTANTRIFSNANGGEQGDSMESNAESSENNPVIASETKQSIKSCEAQPNLAPLRGAEKERKGGSSASALLELEADKARLSPKSEKAAAFLCVGERGGGAALFAKKSDYINENISIESKRSERVESAESLKDSADSIELNHNMDCHALTSVKSRNDDSMLNSHASQSDSRNDKMRADSSHSVESAKDSINSSHFVKSINENNPHNAPHLSTKHRFIKAYLNFTQTKLYLCLCFLLTFNFINIAWVFFRAENLSIALNVLKAMFGFGAPLPEKWYSVSQSLSQIDGGKSSVAYIILAFVLCLVFKNSFELMQRRLNLLTISLAGILLMFLSLKMFATDSLSPFLYFNF